MDDRRSRRKKKNRGRHRAVLLVLALLCILTAGLCAWGMGMQKNSLGKKEEALRESGRQEKGEETKGKMGEGAERKEAGEKSEKDSIRKGENEPGDKGEAWDGSGQNGEDEPDADGKVWDGQEQKNLNEGQSEPEAGGGQKGEKEPGIDGKVQDGQAGEEAGPVSQQVPQMSLEARVAQLFMVTPEQLTGYSQVTQAGEATKEALRKYPVGGLIYFSNNLKSPEQFKAMTANTQKLAGELGMFPLFLAIDEEGGEVARVGNHPGFSVQPVPAMADIGRTGDVRKAFEAGNAIGEYLHELGINVDFAPDADVLTNPDNTVVKTRSFGENPDLVTQMATAYLKGLNGHGVYGAPKHFPGHGATAEDSHKGFAYINKGWEELEQAELVPFAHFAKQKVNFIMCGHISLPAVIGDDTPCSLSPKALDGYLREKMGFQGIIITDALNMGAIQNHYSSGEAAVAAIEAGVDMLLMPANFQEAYQAVLDAVRQGRISEERLNQSVERIIQRKADMLNP